MSDEGPDAPMPLVTRQLETLDLVPASVAVIDARGIIRAVNVGWHQFAASNGRTETTGDVGFDYRTLIDSDAADARIAAHGVLDVISGRSPDHTQVYPCHSPTEQRWFQFIVVPLPGDPPRPVIAVHLQVDPLYDTDGRLLGMAGATLRSLAGLITVCAWCRRRQNLSGDWSTNDDDEDPTLRHSHGICEVCAQEFWT